MADDSYIRFVNVDEVKGKLNFLNNNFPSSIKNVMNKIGGTLLKTTRMKTPVLTGNLRRKWAIGEVKADANEASVEIINNAEYASPVEFGHKTRGGGFVPGRFMLKQGMDETEKQAASIIDTEMQKFVDQAGGK